MTIDPDELPLVGWLVSPQARPWLEQAAAVANAGPRLAAQLRRGLAPGQVRLVLDQVALRRKAAEKFPQAERLFFAATALQQATDHLVAAYKARRFPPGVPVLDGCCGIGGDLLALAARGPVVGVERDPALAILAAANLETVAGPTSSGEPRVVVQTLADGPETLRLLADAQAWHLDPDRRPAGRRTSQMAVSQPPPGTIERMLTARGDAAIKLAPAAEVPAAWAEGAELEWISRDRQCRQLVAWFGRLTEQAGRRRATRLDHTGLAASLVGQGGCQPAVAERIGQYLIEPDAAVLAADLSGHWAAELDVSAIAPQAAYFTTDRVAWQPSSGAAALASVFRVWETLPLDRRRLKELVRARGIGPLEIKKRGVELEPSQLARELGASGDRPATLILARVGRQSLAILGERVGL